MCPEGYLCPVSVSRGGRHVPDADAYIPPDQKQTHTPTVETATDAGGTHPAGMHSCSQLISQAQRSLKRKVSSCF